MTVKELIEKLEKCDEDAEVFFWSNMSRRDVEDAYQDDEGEVWISEYK